MSREKGRRNLLEIAAQILDICTHGAGKTRILYGANLSFHQLGRYLKLLEKRKLVRYKAPDRQYVTTRLGLEFLANYKELVDASQRYSAKRDTLAGMLGNGKRE
jgi:predicted transcriptional regulator